MKNKFLLTTAIALIGIFSFSVMAEANPGHKGRHKHVNHRKGRTVVVWHNNYNQCGPRVGVRGPSMCMHMNSIWNGGHCGNAGVRCNHRGCGMYGMTYRNGNFYNGRNIQQGYHQNHRHHGRYNRGGGRGNGGRYNQGGGRGNNNHQGHGRGNGRR